MSAIIKKPTPVPMTTIKGIQTTSTEGIDQKIMARKKKKKPGLSSLIETTAAGLGGDAPTYEPTLLS